MSQLNYARYGKDNVRLYKVHKHPDGTQSVVEQTVRVLLEGDIETSYTQADNSVIVATDTQKHTVYVLAKQNPVTPPELFASIVGTHFITKYSHIHAAHVKIVTHKWTRMTIDGKPHPHSFVRDGEDIRTVEAVIREGKGISIKSGIDKLLVLKSTGSAFYGFHRDEYTRLGETWDRILSTEVKAEWEWKTFSGLDEVKSVVPKFDAAFNSAKTITLDTFAKDNSASVQNTMYKMSDQILSAAPLVETVSYSLPNKHYFEIDLSWFKGTKNTGKDAEVFAPQTDPNGLIQCTVGRKGSKAKL
ncbi:hypothetical protein SLS57_003171 [Botryosphaeria dothidea]|uniref:Uricase n=1 Tax=Botryosphaeria dothidea TaxID=55169 RepID=A0A8H4N115_9PEZI|nr:putative urate oxidase protein [Botryosphaeria dothidea]